MTKMLITEALDERDFLEKKIRDKINKASFIGLKKNNEETVANLSKKAIDFEDDAKSELQSIKDLISRYHRIDGEIIKSNAATMITVGGRQFSVAEAISIRQKMDDKSLEKSLADKLTLEHDRVTMAARDYKDKLESNAQSLRETISGKESKEDGYGVVEEYIKANGLTMIGIVDAKDVANEIIEGADKMLSEINTAIKVSNATTHIEI